VAVAKPVAAPASAAATPAQRGGSGDDRKAQAAARQKLADQARPIKKEQARVEADLAKAQAEHAALLVALSSPDLPVDQRADCGRRLRQVEEDMATLENRWLELGEQLEAISAS
jgi:ATP-binding cassette subfamily F protein 3